MSVQTPRISGQIAEERIDHVVEWLEVTLGVRLTAFAAGVTSTDVARFAHGDARPGAEAERRLRNLYAVAWLLATRDGPATAHAWLREPNPELENRPPARLLREGQAPEAVWFAAAPAF